MTAPTPPPQPPPKPSPNQTASIDGTTAKTAPGQRYGEFLWANAGLLSFGMALTFCSSFGQTFFIGLFNQPLRDAYGLSHSGFGSLYLLATLSSAATIIWAGLKIDDVELRRYASLVVVGLALSALLMASASHIILLFVALYGLRLTGQGLMGHTSTIAMARYLGRARGKGLSIAALGMPLGEALWPLAITFLLVTMAVPWRGIWFGVALGLLTLILPTIWWLLRGQEQRDAALQADLAQKSHDQAPQGPSLRNRDLLRDRKFIGVLPYVLTSPFLLTGFFFHQQALSLDRGWDLGQFASFYVLYAGGSLVMSLAIGPVVDRVTATRLVPLTCLPLVLGLLAFWLIKTPPGGALLFGLAGMATGIAIPILNAMWAEVYGVRDLGRVRALVSSIMVVATAIAPPIFGLALDSDLGADTIAIGGLAYTALAYGLMLTAFGKLRQAAAALE
ncbi:MAG: MFS transporter [Pseudomonadota bacterium]